MCNRNIFNLIFFIVLSNDFAPGYGSYFLNLSANGPIVKGANITFNAVVYDRESIATGEFQFLWRDNAIPTHERNIDLSTAIDVWTVEYNDTVYPAGPYTIQIEVKKCYLSVYCYAIGSKRMEFNITETLNGGLILLQQNITRESHFVSNDSPVIHNISLKKTDRDFIKNAPTIKTYWFVDCTYYGFTQDMIFPFNYTQADRMHLVEALVVADFTPLPPPTTTTTTTSTTSTTPATTTTAKTTTITTTKKPTMHSDIKPKSTTIATTIKPITKASRLTTTIKPSANVEHTTVKTIHKREVTTESNTNNNNTAQIMVNHNGTLVPYNGSFPFVCNSTFVARDDRKAYGYFLKMIEVKAPVSHINVTGNNWLQHGALLTLNVKCQGSKNLKYCVNFVKGIYNVTGNETCLYYHQLELCEFTIQRFIMEQAEHTVIIIIENEVSKKITPVTVTVYKEKKQAQLSVIVVPVSFSLMAVVLIVFGVAYYLQNRSRFIVEVADFNFGQNYSDMEYKTFSERLRDSITNALFTRAPSPGSSEVPVWPPGRKYGSMTS